MPQKSPVKSVSRAFRVLDLITSSEEGLLLSKISEKVDMPKATTHRMLQALMKEGLVEQGTDEGLYNAGVKIFEMAHQYAENLDVRKEAQNELDRLNRRFNEIIHLAVLAGREVVYIDKYSSSRALQIYSSIGKRVPIHCTALGKAILAYLDEPKLERILSEESLIKYTESTIAEEDELHDELESIHEEGYATDRGEHEKEISCIACPIFNHRQEIEAAVSVTIPSLRFDKGRVEKIAPVLKQAAKSISVNIGYTESQNRRCKYN